MNDPIDLDAYFARIGHSGGREPTLATLSAIHRLHPAAIPFESLDPLMGRPVPLDAASLQRKLIEGRRGGYCFEQNGVLYRVLMALGFDVTPLAARVLWQLPPDAPTPPVSHMLLKVDLPEGPFLADVGFGGSSPTSPLRMDIEDPQPTSMGAYRIVATPGGARELQLQMGEAWGPLYRFTFEPRVMADYEVANWYTSTHPQSRFTTGLILSRVVGDRRINVFNLDRTVRLPDGSSEKSVIGDAESLHAALRDDFGIAASRDEAELVFARLSQSAPATA